MTGQLPRTTREPTSDFSCDMLPNRTLRAPASCAPVMQRDVIGSFD